MAKIREFYVARQLVAGTTPKLDDILTIMQVMVQVYRCDEEKSLKNLKSVLTGVLRVKDIPDDGMVWWDELDMSYLMKKPKTNDDYKYGSYDWAVGKNPNGKTKI